MNRRPLYSTSVTIICVSLITAHLPSVSAFPDPCSTRDSCVTKECLQSATSLKWSINATVDPCDNFYQFVCGGLDDFSYHNTDGLVGIKKKTTLVVQTFLQERSGYFDPEPVRMVRKFYASCVKFQNEDAIDGNKFRQQLTNAGLPVVPTFISISRPNLHTFDWVNVSVTLKKSFGINLFAQWEVGDDPFGTDHALYLHAIRYPKEQTTEHYATSSPGDLVHKFRFVRFIKTVIQMVLKDKAISSARLQKAADVIYNMSFKNPAFSNRDDDDDNILRQIKNVKKMTVEKLQNLSDARNWISSIGSSSNKYSWKRYIELLFTEITGTTFDMPDGQEIYYYDWDLSHLTQIHSFLSKQSAAKLELYAWWRTVFFLLQDTITSGKEISSEHYCTELTQKHLNTALGFGIIPKEFVTDVKPQVTELLENLKKSFLDVIEKSDLLDEPAKSTAIQKINSLKYEIGAPSWIINKTAVLRVYKNVTISLYEHTENMLQLTQASVRKSFNQFINGHDESHYSDTSIGITSVNAYYDILKNLISIPWAILHYPAYPLGLRSLNYGALGTIIGHEITHGFDGNGRNFDNDANYKKWWSSSSMRTFKKKATCFEKQYSNLPIYGLEFSRVNRTETLNEDIADNVGTKIALKALQSVLKSKGPEPGLPGFENYTSEKLFFLSYANIWCREKNNILEHLLSLLVDHHSPHSLRVNGPLQNMDEFAKAFNCPLGSPMNPNRPRCSIW